MSDKIKTTHSGVEITYDVSDNKWVYTLRGKEKSQPSLLLAKEDIDKPPPKEKKAFKRFEVWYKPWNDIPRLATVTSLTERSRYFGIRARITFKTTKRSRLSGNTHEETEHKQVDLSDLYAVTEANNQRVAQIKALADQGEAIYDERMKIEGRLVKAGIKPEDYA